MDGNAKTAMSVDAPRETELLRRIWHIQDLSNGLRSANRDLQEASDRLYGLAPSEEGDARSHLEFEQGSFAQLDYLLTEQQDLITTNAMLAERLNQT